MTCLVWLTDMLKDRGITTPKVILYCKSIKMAGMVYDFVMCQLKNFAYIQEPRRAKNCLVGLYHSSTLDKYKRIIEQSLLEGILTSCSLFCQQQFTEK